MSFGARLAGEERGDLRRGAREKPCVLEAHRRSAAVRIQERGDSVPGVHGEDGARVRAVESPQKRLGPQLLVHTPEVGSAALSDRTENRRVLLQNPKRRKVSGPSPRAVHPTNAPGRSAKRMARGNSSGTQAMARSPISSSDAGARRRGRPHAEDEVARRAIRGKRKPVRRGTREHGRPREAAPLWTPVPAAPEESVSRGWRGARARAGEAPSRLDRDRGARGTRRRRPVPLRVALIGSSRGTTGRSSNGIARPKKRRCAWRSRSSVTTPGWQACPVSAATSSIAPRSDGLTKATRIREGVSAVGDRVQAHRVARPAAGARCPPALSRASLR